MNWEIGDTVLVDVPKGCEAYYGWGPVENGDIGTVVEIGELNCYGKPKRVVLNIPEKHPHWTASVDEIRFLVRGHEVEQAEDDLVLQLPFDEQVESLARLYDKALERPRDRSKTASDGGSTGYYKLPAHATELRHLISAKGMSKARGDIFKACYRLGEKDGVDTLYDLNKMKFFIEDLIEMHSRGEHL